MLGPRVAAVSPPTSTMITMAMTTPANMTNAV